MFQLEKSIYNNVRMLKNYPQLSSFISNVSMLGIFFSLYANFRIKHVICL